ncbi:MAG: hypothetical protein ACR2IV_21320 [Bryobacteraceae bacterium]
MRWPAEISCPRCGSK